MASAGTSLAGLVRIHAYLEDDSMSDRVLEHLGNTLPEGTYPAITFISGEMARPGILMSMDMVAVAPESAVSERVSLFNSEGIFGPTNRSHVAGSVTWAQSFYLRTGRNG